ncbi:Ig-like domain-containing protein [Eubacterium callanderi]|uniref:Ig-like domain-containing protein n=1 Tax=Eubacterium callanderi TaxID=53442 RepID=UPI0039999D41
MPLKKVNGRKFMECIKRRISELFILVVIIFTIFGFGASTSVQAQEAGTVAVSVERFTLGQGYFIEPEIVSFHAGETVKDLLDQILGGSDNYYVKESSGFNFYLSGIKNADSGELNIPYYIQEASGFTITNEVNSGNSRFPDLCEFAYGENAGWMYSVNNTFPKTSMQNYVLKDGDIVRFQFTLWGIGKDIGDAGSGTTPIKIANRDALTNRIAQIKSSDNFEGLLSKGHIQEAYDNAMRILIDLSQSQSRVDQALEYLNQSVDAQSLTGISLDQEKMTLNYDDVANLSVRFEPQGIHMDYGIRWNSSDEDVAYVDNGTVYALGIGTATVTATLGDFSASCEITVKEEGTDVPLQGIMLNPSELSLKKGNTGNAKINYNPNDTTDDKTAIWSSSNSQVASVDQNGLITAISKGEAIITAQVGNFTATCNVTVSEDDPVDPPDITDDDIAIVKEVVRLAAILNTNNNPTLDEVKVVEDAYKALTTAQLSILTETQDANIRLAVNAGYSKVLAKTVEKTVSAIQVVQEIIKSGNEISDIALFELVQVEKELNAVGEYKDFLTQDQKKYQDTKDAFDDLTEELRVINHTSLGVTVNGASLSLPWTVKVEAEERPASSEQQQALESDKRYFEPTILIQFEIRLKDFSVAESADNIPEYGTDGKKFRVYLPAKDYQEPAIGEHEQLTLLQDGAYIGFTDDKGRALVTYDAKSNRFSFATENLSVFTIVSDHRIAIENFTLSDTERTLFLDQSNPAFQISVLSYLPYNTTDKKDLKYSSSNPAVASVDKNGIVTGRVKGTAVITAEIRGLQRQCQVTVKQNQFVDLDSFWPTFRQDNDNMAIVDTALPNAGSNLTEKWINRDINTGSAQMTAGTPMVIDNYVYVPTQNNKIYKLDKNTGAIIKEANLSGKIGFFSYATYGDGMIFVPEEGGVIEVFNADTLDSLWRTESFGGQSNCQLTYADGFIYSGTWNGSTEKGVFFCVDTTKNGEIYQTNGVRRAKWVSDDDGGYYWSGATVVGDAVIFGGDSGQLQSRNKSTGALISQTQAYGKIRSCIAYDAGTSAVYFTSGEGEFNTASNEGKCYKVGVTQSGQFTGMQMVDLPSASTTTPVVYNGRVYVSTGKGFLDETIIDQENGNRGKLSVLDANSMNIIYNIEIGGSSKASPLLTTAYSNDGQQSVYLYITVNNHDGAIVRIKDWAGNTTPQAEVIYRAESDEQEYVTASLNCDADGTIYYRNDRGHLMALTGTSEAVRGAAPVAGVGRRQSGGNHDASNKNASTKKAGAAQAEEEFKPWQFDGAMLPYSKTVSKTPKVDNIKKASIILALTAVGMAVIYIGGAALWPKLGKKP